MTFTEMFQAFLLGIVEGLTEFIPVSSTGHILLLGDLIGWQSAGNTFEVLIQLGAILAIVTVYFGRLLTIARTLPTSRDTQHFVLGVLLAFLPAALGGVLLHDVIKTIFFESPKLICWMLLIGGILLLAVDRNAPDPRYRDASRYPLSLYLRIGLFQCLALVPGVSRSGATIAGALLMGTDKRSAAEFTFFLALPTMAGAFAYDLYQNRDIVGAGDLGLVAIGFVTSFVAAWIVVRTLLGFVSRHGFAPFAYWRMLVGGVGLVAIYLG